MYGLNETSGMDVSKEYIYKVQGQFKRLMIRRMEQIGELGNGRKSKVAIVADWCRANPEGTKADCIRATGLSKKTVYKVVAAGREKIMM